MDFKNSDITSGSVIADLGSADAAVALEAAATLAVALQGGNILPLTADGQLVLPAGVGLDDIKVVGRDLVIQMPDGTQMIVPDAAVFVPQIVVDGVAVPPLNIAALLIGQEPQPAAGRPQSSGGNFADPVGDIGDPFALGDLLPPTQLAFPEPEEREIIPELNDEEPTTIIVTPDQPAGSVSATASVNEAALPARGTEPPGSNESSNAETTTGSIVFEALDGLASITLNGVAITAIGQVFVTPLGRLTITSIAPGNIGYSYTLTDNTTNPISNDMFAVVVTDSDGDTAIANLTISIIDDAPTARNDTDSVPAANYTGQTGNVITGVGTTSGNAGADTQGADGAVLSGIRAGTGAGTFASAGTTINGQYGTLTISANGSYTYTRNAGTPGGVNDIFTYQITDGDGDTSTATLTISIADSPVTITSVPTTGAGTVVDEAGLPARGTEPPGSNEAAPSEATSGTITFTAPDGIASVAINGVNITGAGQVITVPTGTLLITGYNPATGTLTYTFTLTDNTSGDATTQVFTITVTDTDGDTASSPFTVRIIDDVPTARSDSGTQTAENAPVTVNIIANDTQGADGVNLATGVALVAGSLSGTGTLVYNGNGTFTYTPAPGEEGVVTFNYTITDGDGDVSTATVTISLLADSTPTLNVAGDSDVNESGLPARAGEPEGSDAAAPSETAVGTITVGTGGDSVVSLVINGVNVTAGGTVTTALGTLVITVSGGVYSYSYTLTDNTLAATSSDTFTIVLTDSDGDTASSNLVIAIIDDAPTAVADTDSIAAGNYGPATGNVISDSEGDGGKDVQGADGVTVTNVTGAGGSGGAGTAINGLYGVLTLNADGSYSYVRNAGSPGGVSDVFTYTLTDGDGDTSTTTLTIAIADSPVSLTLPVTGAAGTVVDEAGLPAGSNAASDSEMTSGTIAYVAADGPATVTIDGVAVTAVGQTFTGSFGTLKITSIANGVIGYEYLLTTNTSGDATFDDFAIVVTDQDGDSSNGTLVIDIVDDVPTARADVDSVTEDDFSGDNETVSADGNVLTGVGGNDANSTDGVADIKGADGASVTAVAFGATAGTVGGSTAGEYGTLTLNADGSYSYVLNNFDPRIQGLDGDETLTEIFTYTITDGDGDARTTTLTITINGSDDPITINGLNIEGPELVVDDDDLPDGSSPNAPALTKTGSFTVNGVDGIASIKVGGTEVFVGQTITTASGTFTITAISSPADGNANSITISYSFTLNDNTAHPIGGGENSITESFEVVVTDTDGSTDTDFIDVRIIDDVPTAVNDTDSIAAGEFGPATGNVITDAEADGGADTSGADGASVTAIVGAAAGTVGGTTAGLYGVLTLNADGSYSYVRNAGTPGGFSDVFTYTITDSDGDTSTATLTIAIADAKPVTAPNAAVLLDDDALTGGNADGTGDDVDAANLTGTLAASGGDGPLSWAYTLVGAPAGFNYVANGSGIDVFQGATKVLAITLNTATGAYTVTQLAPIVHAAGSAENNQGFTISYNVTDTDGDASSGTLTINVDDDTPTAANDVDEIVSGSNAPATGNVITDAEGDGGKDSVGADGGAAIVAITGFGGAGTVGGVTNGQYGKLTINADGSYSYVRNAGTPGNVEDVFTYTLTDADGDTVTATLTISIEDARPITGLNATVLLDDDALAGGNDGGTGDDANAANLTGTLAGSGGDGALTWAYQTSGNPAGFNYVANGTGIDVFQGATKVLVITLNSATGAYSVAQVAPIIHANGGDENNQVFTINYTVTDADGDASPGTLTINVDDDSPTATDDGQITIEGAPAVTGNVLSNDSAGADMPGSVTFVGATAIGANTVIVGTYGTLTISSNGSYSYVPNASVPNGSVDSFTYTMRDADGDTAVATLRFTFEGDANRPTAGEVNASVDDDALGGNADGTGDLPDGNADGDNNQATFKGVLPNNFGLDGAGKISFSHLEGQFIFVGTESVQLSWNEGSSTLTATGGRGVLFTVVVNQATGAYTVTLLDNVLHNGGADENNATGILTYRVTDSDGSIADGTLRIDFDDDTPIAAADTDAVTEDGTTTATGNVLTGVGTDGNIAGADSFGADGQSPLGAVTAVTGGSLGVAIVGTYGSLTLNANGSYSFVLNNASAAVQGLDSGETVTQEYTYTIRDGDGDETTATLTITINGTNDAPVVNADTNWTIEDAAAAITGNVLNTVAHNGAPDALARGDVADTDVDVETLTVTTTGAINGLYGILTLNANGSYSYALYTQAQNAAAYALIQSRDVGDPPLNDVFNYTVTDGTAPVGSTLTIAVFGANDAPVANPDSNWTIEDAAAAITGNVLNTVAHNGAPDALARGDVADTDVDVETLTVTTTGAINGLYGILTLNADGSYSYALYTQAQNAAAYALIQARDTNDPPLNDVFNYTVTDGTAPVGSTLTIAVFGANDAPVANPDSNWTIEDAAAAITGNVLNTVAHNGAPDALARGDVADTDVDVETLTVTTTGAINGLYGILTLNADGSYSYALYTQAQNAAAYALIQSRDTNDPPLNDVFNYTVTDGTAPVGSTLTIAVFGANDAPVALADTNWVVDVATGPNPTTTGNVLQTLAHDGAPDALTRGDVADTDVDVETLTVTTVGSFVGTYGTLVLNADGSYTYTLNANNAAVNALDIGEKLFDTFNYTASDGTSSAGATLTIAVFGTNDAPGVNADTNWTIEDAAAPITGNVLNTVAHNGAPDALARGDAADTDVDAEPLVVTTTGPINGLYGILTLNADGSYSYVLYTEAQNAAAYALIQGRDIGDPPLNDVFNYTATDGTTPVDSTLTIAVFGANDAPTLGTATVSVSEEGLLGANPDGAGSPDTTDVATIGGTITVGDVDGEALTVTLGDPGPVLTADGLPVTWSGMGTGTLIGSVGAIEVIRVTINNSGAFTVTLSQSIDHPLINVEDLKTITIPVSVFDGTATTTNPTALTINIEDDSPVTFTTQPVTTGLNNVAGSTVTRNLDGDGNINNNVGADQPGKIQFSNIVNGQDTLLKSGSVMIELWLSNDGQTLQGRTGSTNGTDGTLIYTVQLNQAAGTYTVTMAASIDNGSGVSFNDLSGGDAGNPSFKIIESTSADSLELLFTPINGGSINSDTDDVGVDGQFIDITNPDAGLRIDFGSFTFHPNGGGGSDDRFSIGAHTLVNGFKFMIDQISGGTTADIRLAAINADEDGGLQQLTPDPTGDTILVISSVKIFNAAGVLVGTATRVGAAGGDTSFGAITVDFEAGGTVLLSQLPSDYSIQTFTVGAGYDRIEITNAGTSTGGSTDGKFSISTLQVETVATGNPVNLAFDLRLTDSDGDFVNGSLAITVNPAPPPLAPLFGGADLVALPGETMLFDVEQEPEQAGAGSDMSAQETASPAIASLVANERTAEQVRNNTNVTATVIAASLVGLPAIADALAAPAPDDARLAMLPDQETAMPDQADLVSDDNVANEGEAGLSADTETTRVTDDEDSSLQAADDEDVTAALDAQPLTPLSDGLSGGADSVDIADILPTASPMGGDAVMHNILDLAAAGLTAASNDNPVQLAIENVVDEALPDSMIDRLVEAFEADADAPVVSGNSASDSSGYLVELINQSVSSSPDFATIHVDPFGSQYNDMANTNNG